MEKDNKFKKVRGSAIITDNDEVFFTPYRRLSDEEKTVRIVKKVWR